MKVAAGHNAAPCNTTFCRRCIQAHFLEFLYTVQGRPPSLKPQIWEYLLGEWCHPSNIVPDTWGRAQVGITLELIYICSENAMNEV